MCIDNKDTYISGDYNSANGRIIRVQLNRCLGEGCAKEEEITKFFKGKSFIFLYNQIRFDQRFFKDESIV